MILHRIVRTEHPTLHDFTSGAALGRPLALETEEALRLHSGISVFATIRQAANHAHQWPNLGGFIAILDIPQDGPINAERTTHRRGHHTLWGSPPELMDRMVAVIPVADVP